MKLTAEDSDKKETVMAESLVYRISNKCFL